MKIVIVLLLLPVRQGLEVKGVDPEWGGCVCVMYLSACPINPNSYLISGRIRSNREWNAFDRLVWRILCPPRGRQSTGCSEMDDHHRGLGDWGREGGRGPRRPHYRYDYRNSKKKRNTRYRGQIPSVSLETPPRARVINRSNREIFRTIPYLTEREGRTQNRRI